MKLRTSFVLSLVSVVWVAACVFATLDTMYNRPCLVFYPGAGTGVCAQKSCHEFLDPDLPDVYYVKSYGKKYKKCGDTEFYLNCEQKDPSKTICAVWYRYASKSECLSALGDNGENLGGAWFQGISDAYSCQEHYWWQ